MPLLEINPGALPHIEHLASIGRALAKRCDTEPLECPHFVLLAARGLVGDRQVGQRVRTQIEGKEMPEGIFAAVLSRTVALDGEGDVVIVLSGRNADEPAFRDWIAAV